MCSSDLTQVTTQLAVEQAEMIRAGRIRPLAVVGTKPLNLEGVPEIPAITKAIPTFPATDNYFGIFVPAGVPAAVTQTLDKIWDEKIAKSEALKKYATSRGAIVAVLRGDAAKKAVMPAVQEMAWGLWERKEAKVDPKSVGIPPR